MNEEVTLDEFVESESVSDGAHSETWESVKLEDVAWKRSDNVDPQEVALDRHVGLEHIEPNTPRPDWEAIDGLSSTKRRFKPGDLLFAKLRPNLEKSAQPDFEGVASSDIFPIVAQDDINSKFLLYRLSSKPAFDHARRTSVGTRMPRTSWNLFSNFEFVLPPATEQRKIATVLYTVDRAIEKTEEIVRQTESVLSGVTDELLIRGYGEKELNQYRIYSFEFQMPADWEVVELQTLNKDSKPICYGIVQPGDYHENGVPILNIEHSRHGDDIEVNDLHRVSTQLHEKYSRSKLTGGEIVISVKGSTGDVGRVPQNIDEWNISRDLARISPSEEINRDWLRFYLSTTLAQKFIHVNSPGSTRDSLNIGDLKQLPILLPPKEEQKQITEAVSQIEYKSDSENKYLHQLKRLKEGLMQDLLSGEIRTTDADIEVPEDIAQHG